MKDGEIVKDTGIIQLQSVINFMSSLGYGYFMPTKSFGSGYPIHKGREWISLRTAVALHNGTLMDWHGKRFRDGCFENIPEEWIAEAKAAKIVHVAKLQHSRKKGVIVQSHKVSFVYSENAEILLK